MRATEYPNDVLQIAPFIVWPDILVIIPFVMAYILLLLWVIKDHNNKKHKTK